VIVSFNSARFIGRCLESLDRERDDGMALEAVLVDNHSRDGTVGVARAAGYPWLRIIENNRNTGFAAAVNAGIRACGSGDVLLLNPDTEVAPGAVRELRSFLETHPAAGIVGPRLMLATGQPDRAGHRGFPTPWASFAEMVGLARLFPRSPRFNRYHLEHLPMDHAHEVDATSGAAMLIRRAVIERVGPFDEAFFMYGEDLDFCLRAKEAGFAVYYNPDATVVHVKGASSGIKGHSHAVSSADRATRRRATEAFHRSMWLFYRKHYATRYPAPLTWVIHATIELRRRLALWRLGRQDS
jgi:GT2 family glycosyltransferase